MRVETLHTFTDGSKIELRSGFGVASRYLVEADGGEHKIGLQEEYRIHQERGVLEPERAAALERVRAYVAGREVFDGLYPGGIVSSVEKFKADLRLLIPGVG